MLTSFELKSYKQLEFALGAANVVLLASCLVVGYFWVLTPAHQVLVDTTLRMLSAKKVVALLPVAALCLVWAWIATQLLRLHDRLHEPVLRKWRAGYDADFVLRALLHDLDVPQEFFERAYADQRLRRKFMQRLFYNFIGDETKTAEGRRLFFYGEMARYWALSLLDIYVLLALIVFSSYAAVTAVSIAPLVVVGLTVVGVVARVYSNGVLDAAHDITSDQVAAVRKVHRVELDAELATVLEEQGMQRSP